LVDAQQFLVIELVSFGYDDQNGFFEENFSVIIGDGVSEMLVCE